MNVASHGGRRGGEQTSVRPPIWANISEVDNMFLSQPLEEGGEPGSLNLSDGQNQCFYPRRSDG